MTDLAKPGRTILILLGSLQLFIGVGAVPAGFALVIDPSGDSIGMPSEWMADTVFDTFLIPGLILMLFNGFGSCAAGILSLRKYQRAGELAIFLGGGLMVWIFVQIQMVPTHWLQSVYFTLGVVETSLGVYVRFLFQRNRSA